MSRSFSLFVLLLATVMGFAQPKYIFYMIGDGMGQNQVLATEMYLAELEGRIGRKQLCMTQFPYAGLASTFSASNSITDSSAAGTCLASGVKTTNGWLGVNPKNDPVASIAEILHNEGWAVGVMTSVSIDHATPGAFYAHVSGRDDYYTIGTQLAKSDYEFFGGGTFYKPFNEKNPDDPNVYDLCEENGYTFCRGREEFVEKGLKSDKVILIQRHEGLTKDYRGEGRVPYAIDRKDGDLTLTEITRSAIEMLSAKGKPFFMMVEGGQIDWACHGNDGATAIGEVIDFDRAIQEAYAFYLAHPDETLIVVTADHETGGLALGNHKYTLDLKLLAEQKASAGAISERLKAMHREFGKKLTYDQVKQLFRETLGLYGTVAVTAEEDAALRLTYQKMMKNKVSDSKNLYASLNALSDQAVRLLNKKSHLGWTTFSHSASAVPVFAIGVGAEMFTGFYDNSDIMPRLLQIAGGKSYTLPQKRTPLTRK